MLQKDFKNQQNLHAINLNLNNFHPFGAQVYFKVRGEKFDFFW
jgi:hypothetical protein